MYVCSPASLGAQLAKQRAETAVAEGRPLGWLGQGEIQFIDDTSTVCSSV